MSDVKIYRDLIVWQKSMEFTTEVYLLTKLFPKDELYGLSQQIRKCAVSVPSNIAEGFGRNSQNDFKRFLQISIGSLFELQTQLDISKNLEYISTNQYNDLFEKSREVERLLAGLIKSIIK